MVRAPREVEQRVAVLATQQHEHDVGGVEDRLVVGGDRHGRVRRRELR